MKKDVVSEVNGYEIHIDVSNGEYPYWVQVGAKWNDTMCWKTLKGATKWCERH